MSMLDMTAALTNPLTMDTVLVLRRQEVINDFGESNVEVVTFPKVRGVIYPDGANKLDRRPESQTVTKTFSFITKFALRSATRTNDQLDTSQADLIVWRSNKYVVMALEDYSHASLGFTKAQCIAQELLQNPPATIGAKTT